MKNFYLRSYTININLKQTVRAGNILKIMLEKSRSFKL